MTDILAAIGIVELERYESETLPRRMDIFQNYINGFTKFHWAQLPPAENNNKRSSCHLFPLKIKGITEATRDKIIADIFEQDVSVNVHFIPLAMMSFYKNRGYDI